MDASMRDKTLKTTHEKVMMDEGGCIHGWLALMITASFDHWLLIKPYEHCAKAVLTATHHLVYSFQGTDDSFII